MSANHVGVQVVLLIKSSSTIEVNCPVLHPGNRIVFLQTQYTENRHSCYPCSLDPGTRDRQNDEISNENQSPCGRGESLLCLLGGVEEVITAELQVL